MCQAIRNGGKRCPIHQHTTIRMVDAVVKGGNLNKRQVQQLFTELRREAKSAGSISDNKFDSLLADRLKSLSSNKTIESSKYSYYGLDNLTRYAILALDSRSRDRSRAMKKFFTKISRKTNMSVQEVETKFNEIVETVNTAERNSSNPEYTESSRDRVHSKNLPSDRASVVAFERLRVQAEELTDVRRKVDMIEAPLGSKITYYGWSKGRLEFSTSKTGDKIFSYRDVPEGLWDSIQKSQSPATVIARNILNLKMRHSYADQNESDLDSYEYRCADCGQFRSSTFHTCPDLNRTNEDIWLERLESLGEEGQEFAERQDHEIEIDENGDAYVNIPATDLDHNLYNYKYISNREQSKTVEEMDAIVDRILKEGHYEEGDIETLYVYSKIETGSLRSYSASNINDPGIYYIPLTNNEYINEALEDSNISVPVSFLFHEYQRYLAEEGEQESIVGSVLFEKQGENGKNAIISHNLECSCYTYIEKGSCRHIEYLEEGYIHLYIEPRNKENYNLLKYDPTDIAYIFESEIEVEDYIDYTMRTNSFTRDEAVDQISTYIEDSKERIKKRAESLETESRMYDPYREGRLKLWEKEDARFSSTPEKMEEARNIISKARAKVRRGDNKVLQYRTEGVTDGICAPGDNTRSFGLEIEFDIKDYEKLEDIAQELYDEGLTSSPYQLGYHEGNDSGWGSWSFEEDSTVDGEIVSPLLKDTPKDWEQVRKVIEIVEKHGGTASSRAGSHVNISSGSLANSAAKHSSLARLMIDNEDTLYRLASNPHVGKHRGEDYCKPLMYESSTIPEMSSKLKGRAFGNYNNNKHSAVNYENSISNYQQLSQSRIEYRLWDSTLDIAVIQQQVAISAALTDLAEREIELEGGYKKRASDSKQRRLGYNHENGYADVDRKSDASEWAQNHGHVVELFDKLFRREEDRRSALTLYGITNNPY